MNWAEFLTLRYLRTGSKKNVPYRIYNEVCQKSREIESKIDPQL